METLSDITGVFVYTVVMANSNSSLPYSGAGRGVVDRKFRITHRPQHPVRAAQGSSQGTLGRGTLGNRRHHSTDGFGFYYHCWSLETGGHFVCSQR